MHGIPILYYHSIADHREFHPKAFLSMGIELFTRQMELLDKLGFETVFLGHVYNYVSGAQKAQRKPICLTFDDGFLDNWVFLFPIAKRLGIRFTIYVNPDFVQSGETVRPNTDSSSIDEILTDRRNWWGYLNWAELREMEKSGLVDIQSHCLTHTWLPVSSRVMDYHRPTKLYPWLVWNRYPASKPYWLTDLDETVIPYGTPIFEHKKAITATACDPSPEFEEALVSHVAMNGGASFFERLSWRTELGTIVDNIRARVRNPEKHETPEQRERRLTEEVLGSKRVLEDKLGKQIQFLCWPGGGEDPIAREIALRGGYLATTKGRYPNRPGADPTHQFRIASWTNRRLPNSMKWLMFRSQIERARSSNSLLGLAATLASKVNRRL